MCSFHNIMRKKSSAQSTRSKIADVVLSAPLSGKATTHLALPKSSFKLTLFSEYTREHELVATKVKFHVVASS